MESYETVSEALTHLKSKGYTLDFNLSFNQLECPDPGLCLKPEDFEITARFRFEGDTNPDDEDVVYVVESKDGKLKGTITSAYGLYADNLSTEMIRKLTMHK
ncbi:MAG: phosphoribosylpyrophosphate synthetase [Chitinophagaceae bacterium]|nr:phosphoribosylpyrophosphate synthetase [Chitinophagaceae bacterium]